MRLRDLHGPVAASTFAGFAGAGLLDVAVTAARAEGPVPFPPLLLLAVGLYGVAGLVAGLVLGGLAAAVNGALPEGGFSALRDPPTRDRAAAAGIIAALVGVAMLAVAAALGQRLLIGSMASQ